MSPLPSVPSFVHNRTHKGRLESEHDWGPALSSDSVGTLLPTALHDGPVCCSSCGCFRPTSTPTSQSQPYCPLQRNQHWLAAALSPHVWAHILMDLPSKLAGSNAANHCIHRFHSHRFKQPQMRTCFSKNPHLY